LARLVIALRTEDRLSLIQEENESPEPHIVFTGAIQATRIRGVNQSDHFS
jgi:hypothetical protein